ncbi:hypothetical protein evm_010294 [Chilo suppressalis]|nr:hypothetical protein evm_010294 [Chilo suppressalis]
MDNLDDSDNNAKITDSAYSASCSNSQSRSLSSKSTHSGSNSSGSSGYGDGQPSTSGSSKPPPAKKSKGKDSKKKKSVQTEDPETRVENEALTEPLPVPEQPKEEVTDVDTTPLEKVTQNEKEVKTPDVEQLDTTESKEEDGFSCVISMHDGVVVYTTSSLTATLGFPKKMWIGRSFIDFIHVSDRNIFASEITNGLAVPTTVKVETRVGPMSTVVCRIRRYRGLTSGFGVKERNVTFMPFLLKLAFKNVSDETGDVIYLVVQATTLLSAFKEPNEIVIRAKPFVMRHSANGNLEYIDAESVPYLGYIPQDIIGTDILQLYHQNDLVYLTNVYETIVKKGGLARSKPYRMQTQNRDFIKLESEWSSFINPWSRKLEFVIAKHHVLEGPSNPDVLQPFDTDIQPIDKKKNQHTLRDNIVKIMNEVLTKPDKLAKLQMSKRCQDLASFMERLMEDQPTPDAELRLEINDQDLSYYKRDSMLGGISPHHDCNDSKSSTETTPSYNQLNYNNNLQRYFESHQPLSFEDYNNVSGEYKLSLKNPKLHYSSPNGSSPLTQYCGDVGDLTNSRESGSAVRGSSPVSPLSDNQTLRLTESLLNIHNAEMEKEIVKLHRETRPSTKGEREKISSEKRQKKKEHLARCNASYQDTTVVIAEETSKNKLHGVKRTSKPKDLDNGDQKHHCSNSRQLRRRHTTSSAEVQPSATITTSTATTQWYNNQVNSTNTFLLGVGIPQPVPIVDPAIPQQVVAMQGIPVQCMMYGQAVYGSPIVYSALGPQVSYPVQQTMMSQMQYSNILYGRSQMNKPDMNSLAQGNNKKPETSQGDSIPAPGCSDKSKAVAVKSSEEIIDKTDGESSHSSFYSSFFKTESGSIEEPDPKKVNTKQTNNDTLKTEFQQKDAPFESSPTSYVYDSTQKTKTPPRRKMTPSWMEQVNVTSELIYKYQVMTKTMDEVLQNDKQRISEFAQPSLVNEQLGQLYMDLQLEGVAARLTLEEGITSSSSSGEENSAAPKMKAHRRKREHSRIGMIYEEDAPLPPPDADEGAVTEVSTT